MNARNLLAFALSLSCFTGLLPTSTNAQKTEYINPQNIHPNPNKHFLTKLQIDRIKKIQGTVKEVDPSPLAKWLDDFSRDQNPNIEINIWEAIAKAYQEYTRKRRLTLQAKRDIFSVLLFRSEVPEVEVLRHLKLKAITIEQAKQAMKLYKAPPKPIEVMRR